MYVSTLLVWLIQLTGSSTFICIVCFGYHVSFLEECSVRQISRGLLILLMIWNFVFLSCGSSSTLCVNRTDRLELQVGEMRLTLYYCAGCMHEVSIFCFWLASMSRDHPGLLVTVQQRKWSACTCCSSPAQWHIAVALPLTHDEFTGCKFVFLTYK